MLRPSRCGGALTTSPTLDRDGVNISFDVHGSGPAIALTHGYSATSEMWSGQVHMVGVGAVCVVHVLGTE